VDFEERYTDVLQNIEFAIVQVYRVHPDLYDAQVESALSWAVRAYNAEARGKPAPAALAGLPGEVAAGVIAMCEWRLGRGPIVSGAGLVEGAPKTRDEIVACLKRVRRSIEYWTREGGRQGYLEFVKGFLP
jgi:hypothetical protein